MGKTQDYIRYLREDRLRDLTELPAFRKLLEIIDRKSTRLNSSHIH